MMKKTSQYINHFKKSKWKKKLIVSCKIINQKKAVKLIMHLTERKKNIKDIHNNFKI